MDINIDDVIDAYLADGSCLLELTERFPQFEPELMAFIRFQSVLDAIPDREYSEAEQKELEERAVQIVRKLYQKQE